jgi:hypothetical protein
MSPRHERPETSKTTMASLVKLENPKRNRNTNVLMMVLMKMSHRTTKGMKIIEIGQMKRSLKTNAPGNRICFAEP